MRRAGLWFALAVALPLGGAARAEPPLEREFNAIVSATTQANHPEALARMQRWVDEHPRDPQAARGLLWMAQLERADHQGERARPLLLRVIAEGAGTEWALHAEKQLADLDLESHHYAQAIAVYERLSSLPAPFWQYVGKSAAKDARSQRLRFYGLLATLAFILSVSASRCLRIRPRALWPIPNELAYPLPVLVVILLASASQPAPEARAVITLALGAIALLWVNGAYLRARPPRGVARIPQALLGLTQALGLFYCAIVTSGLWEKLVDTWQMGAD